MRLSIPVFRNSTLKKFNNYRPLHPYKILLPPVLADHAKTRNLLEKSAPCMDAMSSMMACWKKNEFAPDRCLTEVAKYSKCIQQYQESNQKLKEQIRAGKTKIKGQYSGDAVNKMLKKFPQPRHNIHPK